MEETSGIRKPADIEKRSFEIIRAECKRPHKEDTAPVLYRVIHTTADFDYEENLIFSEGVMEQALCAIRQGTTFITDTNMGLSGINKAALKKMNCEAVCFMADEEVARLAKERGTTRAAVSMEMAAKRYPNGIYVIGNAPTALIRLHELMTESEIRARERSEDKRESKHGEDSPEENDLFQGGCHLKDKQKMRQGNAFRPSLLIGVPVGFVNVIEAKELILQTDVPHIVARGRKGGSNVAAAICNALLYAAGGR
ncbi:MAG: precorrin-8X methylmutase [Lachnospiraceae bacterium]|nr:precorrin-8X methylmutase [Lachnospiraceae bacterium]